jgi:hypothetical protein
MELPHNATENHFCATRFTGEERYARRLRKIATLEKERQA